MNNANDITKQGTIGVSFNLENARGGEDWERFDQRRANFANRENMNPNSFPGPIFSQSFGKEMIRQPASSMGHVLRISGEEMNSAMVRREFEQRRMEKGVDGAFKQQKNYFNSKLLQRQIEALDESMQLERKCVQTPDWSLNLQSTCYDGYTEEPTIGVYQSMDTGTADQSKFFKPKSSLINEPTAVAEFQTLSKDIEDSNEKMQGLTPSAHKKKEALGVNQTGGTLNGCFPA